MGADLNNIVKCQKLTDDHVQFLIYQILRGLKVGGSLTQLTAWTKMTKISNWVQLGKMILKSNDAYIFCKLRYNFINIYCFI